MGHTKKYLKKVSSEKNATYFELRAYLVQKKPVAQNYLFIAISFYRNIVCQNVSKALSQKFSPNFVSKLRIN